MDLDGPVIGHALPQFQKRKKKLSKKNQIIRKKKILAY